MHFTIFIVTAAHMNGMFNKPEKLEIKTVEAESLIHLNRMLNLNTIQTAYVVENEHCSIIKARIINEIQ